MIVTFSEYDNYTVFMEENILDNKYTWSYSRLKELDAYNSSVLEKMA